MKATPDHERDPLRNAHPEHGPLIRRLDTHAERLRADTRGHRRRVEGAIVHPAPARKHAPVGDEGDERSRSERGAEGLGVFVRRRRSLDFGQVMCAGQQGTRDEGGYTPSRSSFDGLPPRRSDGPGREARS